MFESLLILLLFTIGSPSAFAEDSSSTDSKGIVGNLIDYNKYLSHKFDEMAHNLDLLLARKTYTTKENRTSVSLKFFNSLREGGQKESSFNFDVNLKLPNLEERWQLRFSSYDEDEESRGARSQQQRIRPRERSYGAGLAFLQDLGKIRTSFKPRLELKDPLQTSYTLKFESNAEVRPWRVDPRVDFFADSEKGTGQFVSLNMEFSQRSDLSIVSFNEEQYQDFENRFTTTHGVSVAKPIGDRMSLNHTLSFFSTNRPSFHLDDFTASLGFSHEPYRRVLRYTLTPFWRFAKKKHFKGETGVSLDMEVIF